MNMTVQNWVWRLFLGKAENHKIRLSAGEKEEDKRETVLETHTIKGSPPSQKSLSNQN